MKHIGYRAIHTFFKEKDKKIQILAAIVLLIVLLIPIVVVIQDKQARQNTKANAQLLNATAVSTYQSIGLYWSPAGGSSTNKATVQYRKQGDTAWKEAQPLWYDARDTQALGGKTPEYRGSIVMLQAETTYEVKLTLASGPTTTLTTTTWTDPEKLPIARTVTVPFRWTVYDY
jgi:hypothetical protein